MQFLLSHNLSFQPVADDELVLEVGDTVQIIRRFNDGWIEGSFGNQLGFFPVNHLVELPTTCKEADVTSEAPLSDPISPRRKASLFRVGSEVDIDAGLLGKGSEGFIVDEVLQSLEGEISDGDQVVMKYDYKVYVCFMLVRVLLK